MGEVSLFAIIVIRDILKHFKPLLLRNSPNFKSKYVKDGCLIAIVYEDGPPTS